jgi:hypothetical protein
MAAVDASKSHKYIEVKKKKYHTYTHSMLAGKVRVNTKCVIILVGLGLSKSAKFFLAYFYIKGPRIPIFRIFFLLLHTYLDAIPVAQKSLDSGDNNTFIAQRGLSLCEGSSGPLGVAIFDVVFFSLVFSLMVLDGHSFLG